MPSWGPGIIATILLSAASACGFLLARCRRAGRPFGPTAKWWAVTVIAITAIVSTALGVAAVAVSHHTRAAYVGLIVPSALWLEELAARRRVRRGRVWPQRLVAYLMFPLRRLDDRMGEDMQYWCDERVVAASAQPRWLAEAAQYYYNQVKKNRIKDERVLQGLIDRRDAIVHKINIVNLISRRVNRREIHTALQSHPSTRGKTQYKVDDLDLLASRLESDAQNELHLFLTYLYHLRFRKLLIYPFRPQGKVRRIDLGPRPPWSESDEADDDNAGS